VILGDERLVGDFFYLYIALAEKTSLEQNFLKSCPRPPKSLEHWNKVLKTLVTY
jgi:hypothetical protein